jgi:hypothetical protein
MQGDGDDQITDWAKASKGQLHKALLKQTEENQRLRESVARLMKRQGNVVPALHRGEPEDFVPVGWVERHGIEIPRADGYFESSLGWVRVKTGIITNAGLKNQSVLSLMILKGLFDSGAERDANMYMDWRAAFFARVEAARYSNEGIGDPDSWSKEDRFSKLLKAVERRVLRRVDAIVTSYPKEKDIKLFNEDAEVYIQAFRRMAKAMTQINRDADKFVASIRRPQCSDANSIAHQT